MVFKNIEKLLFINTEKSFEKLKFYNLVFQNWNFVQ